MTKLSGSFGGSGGIEGGLFPYDFEQCQELCESRPGECKKFQSSPERQHCKLFNDTEPANNTNHQDFVICIIGILSLNQIWIQL